MGAPRRLLSVALLPAEELSLRIDAVRQLLADPRLADLPSHLTLVPPMSLDPTRAEAVRSVLRSAAGAVSPFSLSLGPVESFAPRTPTLHLRVDGDLAELGELRERLRVDPLDRPSPHTFRPHVTLMQRAEPGLTDAARDLLVGEVGEWSVDSVVLLERLTTDDRAVWCPIVEEPLGGPVVVGRGGVELHLRSVRVLDPGAAALVGLSGRGASEARRNELVTTAETAGAGASPTAPLVGAAVGTAGSGGAVLERIVVAEAHRGCGIARQVLSAWIVAAGRRGAGVVVARFDDPSRAGVLESLGFVRLDGDSWCRRVVGAP